MDVNATSVPIAQPLPAPQPTNPSNVQSVYANGVGLSANFTDVQLIFTQLGQGFGPEGDTKAINEIKAMIVLPVTVAEALINSLNMMVAAQKTLKANTNSSTQR